MADPYWRYGPSAERVSVPRPAFPGYLTSEAPTLESRPPWSSHDLLSNSSDFLQKDSLVSRTGAYGPDDIMGVGVRRESGFSGYTAGSSLNGYPSTLGDPYLIGRRDVSHPSLGNGPGITNIVNEMPDSLKNVDGLPGGSKQSNVLFVDGLPSDCSRREASHLFRPFFGFKEIRVVHKEPRHREDKAMVLCFVEFVDSKSALNALEALQGYKFDNLKHDSPSLRIHFAHFPFRLPSEGDEQHLAVPRENAHLSFRLPSEGNEQHLAVPRENAHFSFRLPSEGDEQHLAVPSNNSTGQKRKAVFKPEAKMKMKTKPVVFKPEAKAKTKTKPQAKPKTKEPVAKDDKCFECQETGHWKCNCPKYLEKIKDGEPGTSGTKEK